MPLTLLNLLALAPWLLLSLALLRAPFAHAQSVRIDGIEVREAGIYSETMIGHRPSEKTATGALRITRDTKLIEPTETVCARLGVTFGFTYTLLGAPEGQPVDMTAVTRFPAQGMTNAQGRHFLQNEYPFQFTVGGTGTRTFTFEEPWEIVPGTWTFEFHHNGAKVGEKTFTVMAACPIV